MTLYFYEMQDKLISRNNKNDTTIGCNSEYLSFEGRIAPPLPARSETGEIEHI